MYQSAANGVQSARKTYCEDGSMEEGLLILRNSRPSVGRGRARPQVRLAEENHKVGGGIGRGTVKHPTVFEMESSTSFAVNRDINSRPEQYGEWAGSGGGGAGREDVVSGGGSEVEWDGGSNEEYPPIVSNSNCNAILDRIMNTVVRQPYLCTSLSNFLKDYRSTEGEPVPLAELWVESIRELAHKYPGVIRIIQTDQGAMVYLGENRQKIVEKEQVLYMFLRDPGAEMSPSQFAREFYIHFHYEIQPDYYTEHLPDVLQYHEREDDGTHVLGLSPTERFGLEVRDLLVSGGGESRSIRLSLLEGVYEKKFHRPLVPRDYGYPSALCLIRAVSHILYLKGRGLNSTVALNRIFLNRIECLKQDISYRCIKTCAEEESPSKIENRVPESKTGNNAKLPRDHRSPPQNKSANSSLCSNDNISQHGAHAQVQQRWPRHRNAGPRLQKQRPDTPSKENLSYWEKNNKDIGRKYSYAGQRRKGVGLSPDTRSWAGTDSAEMSGDVGDATDVLREMVQDFPPLSETTQGFSGPATPRREPEDTEVEEEMLIRFDDFDLDSLPPPIAQSQPPPFLDIRWRDSSGVMMVNLEAVPKVESTIEDTQECRLMTPNMNGQKNKEGDMIASGSDKTQRREERKPVVSNGPTSLFFLSSQGTGDGLLGTDDNGSDQDSPAAVSTPTFHNRPDAEEEKFLFDSICFPPVGFEREAEEEEEVCAESSTPINGNTDTSSIPACPIEEMKATDSGLGSPGAIDYSLRWAGEMNPFQENATPFSRNIRGEAQEMADMLNREVMEPNDREFMEHPLKTSSTVGEQGSKSKRSPRTITKSLLKRSPRKSRIAARFSGLSGAARSNE